MALSGSFYTTGYSGGGSPDRLIFEWTAVQDIATNKSTITWTVKVGGGASSGYYNTLSKRFVKVGSYQHTEGADWLDGSQLTVYNGTTITGLGGTTEIQHNQDGTGSFTVDLKGMFEYSFVGNNYVYNSTGSMTFTLDKIPRKATILSAPNFTDLDSPVVTYQNLAGSASTLRIGISFDGETDDIEYRAIPSASGSYTFSFTSEELSLLRETATTPSISVYFLLETTIGEEVFLESVEKTFSVADTEDSKPLVLVLCTPDNRDIPAGMASSLLGKYVQQISKVSVNISVTGKYDATIDSVTTLIEGQAYSGTSFTSAALQGSGTIPVMVTATDSRGHSKTATVNISVIPYSYPFLSLASVVRCDANGNPKNNGENLKLTATRNFSSVNSVNRALIEHRTKRASQDWGSQLWTTDLPTTTTGTNTFSGVVSGTFDKTVAYTVQVRCRDLIGNSSTLEFDIPTEDVNLHLREGGKGIGMGKYCTRDNEVQVAYKVVLEDEIDLSDLTKTSILDIFYPIGTIYTSTDSTDPNTLFGGTWSQTTEQWTVGTVYIWERTA